MELVRLQAASKASSWLKVHKGLTPAAFRAKDTTVIGSVISKAAGGSVELERVTMVRAKDLSEMDITYDVELKKVLDLNSAGTASTKATIGILYDSEFTEALPQNYSKLKELGTRANDEGRTAEVVVETSEGVYSTVRPTDYDAGVLFSLMGNGWRKYGDQIETNTVVTEEIFQLDFNKFLKVKGSFRPLYQKLSTI